MKKIIALLLIFALFAAFSACKTASPEVSEPASEPASEAVSETPSAAEDPADDVTVRVASLKGPTSMGLVKLMEDCAAEDGAVKCEFTVAGSADEITPKFIQGDFDIVSVPANLASVLWNRTEGKIKVLAINTLGVLYIVAKNETINSVADLRGKTIYATGKGSTPEYGIKKLLELNGLDPESDVTFEWKSQPDEVVPVLKTSESAVAMLPQPYVTAAMANVEGLEVKLSLNDEWNKFPENGMFITSVIAVNSDFAAAHPRAVEEFMRAAAESCEYAVTEIAATAALVEKYVGIKTAVAQKALPQCNIKFISGSEMKSALAGYLGVLYGYEPKSVGGNLPGDGFYYE